MNSNNLGGLGEDILCEHLKAQGYHVNSTNSYHNGDLTVYDNNGNELKIEVKTAKRSQSGHWQFLLKKNDAHGATNCADSDLVCLLQMHKMTINLFVVPSGFLLGKQKISIRTRATDYNGKYKPFLQNIRMIDLFNKPYELMEMAQ